MHPADSHNEEEPSLIFDGSYVPPKPWWRARWRTFEYAMLIAAVLGIAITVFTGVLFLMFASGVVAIFSLAMGEIWYRLCPLIDRRFNKAGQLRFRHRLFLWSLIFFVLAQFAIPCSFLVLTLI